jgi:hypothetical protein
MRRVSNPKRYARRADEAPIGDAKRKDTMSTRFQRITPFLWFNDEAEVA